MRTSESEAKESLRRMLANGPLTALPRRQRDLDVLLALGAARFDPDRPYSEAQVNGLLQAWLSPFSSRFGVDHVTVRRCLVDAGLLLRDKSGAAYRLADDRLRDRVEDRARNVDPGAILAETRAARQTRMRPVKTDVLRLEPQVAAHAEAMFAVLADPAIYEHENEPPPSLEWLRTRFEKLETRRSADASELWLNWVIRLPGAGLIGYVQATVIPDVRAEIAYVLASEHWGRGLAQEAVSAMIGELVEFHGVRSLSAELKRTNVRSRRLLERLGFALASPELHAERRVEPDEFLMLRDVEGA